jgi:hypothetical protein
MAVTKPNAANKTQFAFKRRLIRSNNFENSSVENIRRSTSLPGVTQQVNMDFESCSFIRLSERIDSKFNLIWKIRPISVYIPFISLSKKNRSRQYMQTRRIER